MPGKGQAGGTMCSCAHVVLLIIATLPLAAAAQDLRRLPRTAAPGFVIPPASSDGLEQRFLAASGGWSFYHRIDDLPQAMRDVLFKAASAAIVDTGESFNTRDEGAYGTWTQHLFSAATDDLWVMVWYAGGFNGPQLMALLYDPATGGAFEYGFGKALGAIALEPELKNLVRLPQPGWTRRYFPPGTR